MMHIQGTLSYGSKITKKTTGILCVCMIVCGLFVLTPKMALAERGDHVVVLHGIAKSSESMKVMENFLKAHHYDVLNLGYPSTRHDLETLVHLIHQKVKNLYHDPHRKLHFVTHSMGGILVRVLLKRYPPENLGRVVMLAPPNRGSEAADLWKNNWLYKKILGPSGQQLTTDQKSLEKSLGKIDFELGVIAGDRSIDPLHSLIIPGPDDGKVAVLKTRIPGLKDHVTVHATHTFIMDNAEALNQTVHFLKNGKFKRDDQVDGSFKKTFQCKK